MTGLILKRASASRLSGEWSDDDYDVVADSMVVGRIFKSAAAPVPTVFSSTYSRILVRASGGSCANDQLLPPA
jgi:hypothetical protein